MSNLPPRKLRSALSVQIQDDDDEDQETAVYGLGLSDVYSSDEFRMYEFKIRRCNRARSHDWTDCPFAHPGEKARRRDPRKFHYAATMCPSYKSMCGDCPRGDACEFAHGVFECWLHPARYRTTPCKDGKACRRKVCFFAHTRRQLRVVSASPTSTLVGFGGCCSPPVSPPAPVKGEKGWTKGAERYGEVLGELVSRLEAMEIAAAAAVGGDDGGNGPSLEWVDELLE